jgi:rubredoxin
VDFLTDHDGMEDNRRNRKMNRRQFIKICSAFWGVFTFTLMGMPSGTRAQSDKDTDDMSEYVCEICGYIYDAAKGDSSQGIQAGTPFKKLPDSWRCPFCGVDKSQFTKRIF